MRFQWPTSNGSGHKNWYLVCLPQECVCGSKVDKHSLQFNTPSRKCPLHLFPTKMCLGKHTRHSLRNDAVWRPFQRAQIQAKKDPAGLKVAMVRPNKTSLISWKQGHSVTWDVTVLNTFASSYISASSVLTK